MLHVKDLIQDIVNTKVSNERKQILTPLIDYIKESQKTKGLTSLNFICTHNSRRSQFSQVWAHLAASHFNMNIECHSAGVEVTACNERTIASLKRFGLLINIKNAHSNNPVYEITYQNDLPPVVCFSKLYNDSSCPSEDFAAIMTCAHADKNCPVIPGANSRIPIRYEDPKKHDDTRLEEIMYDERSLQIATEMFYVFNKANVKQNH